MVFSPSAQDIFRNSDAATFAVFCAAVLGISTNVAGQSEKPEVKDQSAGREEITATIATAKWEGATPAGDAETTAVCVKKQGMFVCLVPDAAGDNNQLTLTINGEEKRGEILVRDRETGLCLAKVDSETSTNPAPLSTEKQLKPGSKVVQLNHEVSSLLAGKDREYLGETLPVALLRIHLAGTATNGEPLFCKNGAIAGLLTSRKLQHSYEAHAVPAARIAKLIADYDEIQLTGSIWIGASFHRQSTTPQILVVKPDSPAERAGLEPGDIILKIDGKQVASLPELAGVCENLSPGKPVELEVLRKLETFTRALTPELSGVTTEKKSKNSSNKID